MTTPDDARIAEHLLQTRLAAQKPERWFVRLRLDDCCQPPKNSACRRSGRGSFITSCKLWQATALEAIEKLNGHAEAQFRLGVSYYFRICGTPVKTVQGLSWISVAAARGHEEAADMKAALALLTPRLTNEDKRQVDELAQRYWNDHVLPFRVAE